MPRPGKLPPCASPGSEGCLMRARVPRGTCLPDTCQPRSGGHLLRAGDCLSPGLKKRSPKWRQSSRAATGSRYEARHCEPVVTATLSLALTRPAGFRLFLVDDFLRLLARPVGLVQSPWVLRDGACGDLQGPIGLQGPPSAVALVVVPVASSSSINRPTRRKKLAGREIEFDIFPKIIDINFIIP